MYHAIHEPTGAPAAVKVVRVSPERRPVRNNLAAEVRAVVALDHPHVIQVFDLGKVDSATADASDGRLVAGTPWYAMELADGGSLRQRLPHLDWDELRSVLLDLLDALAHAHARGVLHLDLKPDNVLFGGRRTGAKLGDFGMGLVGPADPDDDFVRGTPHFMAPEQVRGRWEELGPWTDLYALGCLTWRCVTGAAPFAASGSSTQVLKAHLFADPGPFALRLDVPPGVEGWVRRLLNKDPEHRIRFAADASAQLVDLDGAHVDQPVPDWRVPEHEGAAEVSPLVGLGLAAVRTPPVVGRTREREQLWDALLAAHAGEVRVVTVRGGPGVGKSRLARWLGIRAHELGLGLPLEAGHGLERAAGDGIVGALRATFPSDPRSADAESELGHRLQSRGLDAIAARDTASLLVHGPLAETPGGRPWWEAVGDAIAAVAAERVPIVILDDAHWGDPSLECLLALVHARRLPPSVWVLTVDDVALVDRPTEHELLDAIARASPGHVSIELGPLSELASPALARRMLALTPGVAAEVVRLSAGSPGRQVDLVQDWARRGALVATAEGYGLSDPSVDARVLGPGLDRLEALVAGRRDGGIAVQVAATLGASFTAEDWQEVTAALGATVPPGLPFELLRARIVRRIDGRRDQWAFVDPHLRERVEGWSAADPRDVHLACATCIDPADAERRGRHLMAAGLPEQAAPLGV
ncbi:MAG: AAA family ATPase, partial [Myxococcota bacterium]